MLKERCSCGARFETNSKDSARLWREWRKNHVCRFPQQQEEIQAVHGDTSQVEIALGFQPGEVPAKKYDPWEDE